MPVRCVSIAGVVVGRDRSETAALAVSARRGLAGVVVVVVVEDRSQRPGARREVHEGVDLVIDPGAIGLGAGDERVFAVVAAAAGCHPNEVLHVGPRDDPAGPAARAAGARWACLVPSGADAPGAEPDATVASVAEIPALVERLDAEELAASGAVGVGPHPVPWPSDPRLDPDLLAGGDRRNVVDRYRYWREDAIVADLDARRHPFHVAVENWRHDRNIGTVVRNANAFGASAVHIVGRRRWNRRGAMATDRYLPVHHHGTVDDLVATAAAERLAIVGVDNVAGSVPLEITELPERALLVFGQEGPGLSPESLAAATMVVSITQYGSTRSVNAGVASGIAMHAWVRRHARATGPGDGA